jgi:two-component system, cell cycle response regulator DivK
MSKKILVIEDNQQNMYLTTFLLEKSGYEVIQAWTGVEGIKMAEESRPDLILLDIQLPEMDGYEVAWMLKKIPEVSKIPIVAVTSYAMRGDKENVMAAGCDGYIEKPINPDTFISEIEQYLKKGNHK